MFQRAILFVLLTATTAPAAPPNVVFILVDDWGITDAGVLGSDYFETPVIDRLAADSLLFTEAYASSPVCSPTRAAIMTGKSPARLDMTIWHEAAVDGGPRDRRFRNAPAVANLPRDEVTLAELFHAKGYYTAHIGKWHLGKAGWYPETQGYDLNVGGTYWGAPVSFFYPYRGHWSKNDPEQRYVPTGPGTEGDYLTDRLTDHAVDMLHRQKNGPFFLSLWYHTVHTPIQGRPELVDRFTKKPRGQRHQHAEYAAMVASLDDNIGRILTTLDQLELAENTVVILTSDNGGVDFPSRKSGDQDPTSNRPWRSGKGTLYEGGIRVPMMIRWPGQIRPGSRCSTPVISHDFLPTLIDGCKLSETLAQNIDGRNLMPLLAEPDESLGRNTLYWHYPHYYPRMTPGSAIRSGQWKLIHYYEDDRMELYNLQDDPGESRNLATDRPQRVRDLRQQLDLWRTKTGANAPTINRQWNAPQNSRRDKPEIKVPPAHS